MSARSAASGMRSGSASAAVNASLACLSASAGRSRTSDDDIDVSLTQDHLVALQPQARVRRTFTSEQLVFPAMPGAHDVRIIVVIGLANIGLVRCEELDHLALNDTLA